MLNKKLTAGLLTGAAVIAGTHKSSPLGPEYAGNLLKEALSGFEMTQRGYMDKIALLRSQNDKLTKLIEERSQLLQQREDFMMVVTHDLKTPIIAADRCLDLMLDGDFGAISPQQSQILLAMKDSNHRMFTMVKNLLDVYKFDQSAPVIWLQEVNGRELIMSVINEFALALRAHGLELRLDLKDDLQSVLADDKAIQHVFTNLIDNAIKFTPRGGVITLSACNSDALVRFEVKDTGRGISAEDLPKMFQRCFQSATGRKHYTGAGIGLYLCQQIMHAHGSQIQCESQVDAGTTFTFNLPAFINQEIGGNVDSPPWA